jgi:hypothetical protein
MRVPQPLEYGCITYNIACVWGGLSTTYQRAVCCLAAAPRLSEVDRDRVWDNGEVTARGRVVLGARQAEDGCGSDEEGRVDHVDAAPNWWSGALLCIRLQY